jgi:integration host factor subunit alpha
VERLLRILKETLAGEEDVMVSGFGKFQVKRKSARRGRNPQTKEAMELRQRRVVVFRTSGILRRKINGGEADTASGDDFDSEDTIRAGAGRKADEK